MTVRLAAVLMLALVTGCDADIPAASADGRSFTIWGQLDPSVGRQVLRIDPIALTIDGTVAFEGEVTSIDLATGTETAWRDSVATFPDGSTGTLFLADYQPAYDSRVEVRVTQQGEVTTYARVTIPPRVTPFFGDLRSGIRNELDLLVPGAPRVVGARVVYDILGGRTGAPELAEFVEAVPIEPEQIASVEFGWRVRVDFTRQVEVLRSRFLQREIRAFNATGIRVIATVANDEWRAPYPFTFSRALLIQPGAVSNVRGGYGFLGAAYTLDLEWEASAEDLQRLGLL